MKRYVLPTLKILIAVVIAVALVKIAFFPDTATGTTANIDPGISAVTQTTTVTTGDISNTVDVSGQIVEDAAVEAQATLNGVVDSFAVQKGATVTQGEPLVYLKQVEPQEPTVVSVDEEGNTVQTPVEDKVTWATVYAPASGVVSFNVIQAQETSVGMVVATVAPGTYSATGTITADQQYRLTNAPTSATLSVENGPAPFECTNLKIGTRETTSTTTNQSGEVTTTTGDGTSVEVRCAVPSEQQVFPGLSVTIGIDAGSVTDALVVPVTAVEGSVTKGNVWVVTDPSNPEAAEEREVALGITDGTSIQVTEGLAEGDEILLFVPNKDTVRTGEPNTCEPDGSACYDENGEEIL
ncbi:efflux RND transporter periplasmic adaptor subunit [Actinomyces sp. MRS3W]|uniref:efflux RND transporter periplasmic adaptor subunit n=1 Tax=Actinomyces sp. MRS3W TaxID=2800796 RepID=UPI0028FD205B|nr:efflux RND transporter periplasmic adaptor subunit [Actinomyces sp. MRS3W]MDU0348851.1 efflux RND transporter periplasmic adaptor subunit [Actinomyces sp. MRS3W]